MRKKLCAVMLLLGFGMMGGLGGCIDVGDENPCVVKAGACHDRCYKNGQEAPCHDCCTDNGQKCIDGRNYNFVPCRFKD